MTNVIGKKMKKEMTSENKIFDRMQRLLVSGEYVEGKKDFGFENKGLSHLLQIGSKV